MKRIVANEDVCIGCRLCEIYCTAEHSESKNLIKAFLKESPRPLARVQVEEEGAVSFALQCRHCANAPCIAACITGAMHEAEDGTIQHDKERCVGCWTCILVCPYGAIQRDEREKKVASKCDFCAGLEMPACVANCPNEALTLTEV